MQMILMDRRYQIHIYVRKQCIALKELNLLLCVQMVNGLHGRDPQPQPIVYHVNEENGVISLIYLKI